MNQTQSPIERACNLVGSQAVMARILEVSPAMVNQLVKGLRPVPIEHCQAIEAATHGAVTRRELRPDDWQKIWPELADPAIKSEAPEAEGVQLLSPQHKPGLKTQANRAQAATDSVASTGTTYTGQERRVNPEAPCENPDLERRAPIAEQLANPLSGG
jgi:DNA-binding transcriptional regulator YdaS (Cro superfamily)